MATGKTTVGRALAERLGLALVDSDAQLESATGMTAAEVAADRGRDDLHALEADLLLQALATTPPSVVAGAASVVDDPAAREALGSDDLLVAWLEADPETLASRVAPGDDRPRYGPDMERYLAEQARHRDAVYAGLADVVVDATDPVGAIVERLAAEWARRDDAARPSAAGRPMPATAPPFDPTSGPRDPGAPPLSPGAVAWLLEASLSSFEAELLAMGDELAAWHPVPGAWCAREIVGHVIEADRRGFSGRIGRILEAAGDAPIEESGWDQAAVAADRRDCERSLEGLAAELRAVREPGLVLLRSLGERELSLRARHQTVGEVTVGELLQEWVFHDRNHLRQLLANAQARVWPVMGNTRRFTDPDA
jgi:shikimate kinase